MDESLNKSNRLIFFTSLQCKNLNEILFRKHCKEEAFIVTKFWPYKKIISGYPFFIPKN